MRSIRANGMTISPLHRVVFTRRIALCRYSAGVRLERIRHLARLLFVQRRWIWFGCFALGILAIALSFGRQSEDVAFPIDSESELRVLKVSLGTNHVYSFEPRWKQVARRLLPDRWEAPLGP